MKLSIVSVELATFDLSANAANVALAITVILISAKIEQPISPSFNRMITLVNENDPKHYITK